VTDKTETENGAPHEAPRKAEIIEAHATPGGQLVPREWGEEALMPAMALEQALERYKILKQFIESVLVDGRDYGAMPGKETKVLLKPGAEKLSTFFGLTKEFVLVDRVEDWTGGQHGGEPFFYYLYRCRMFRRGLLVAECDGSCNSWESKYRYRKAERVCPDCGEAAIIKGKVEYGGGWLCWTKRGGCGAKFADQDGRITEQVVGRVKNPDAADAVNTVLKMAQKRAFVGSVVLAVNASDYFTHDVEDFGLVKSPVKEAPAKKAPAKAPTKKAPAKKGRAKKASAKTPGKWRDLTAGAETLGDLRRIWTELTAWAVTARNTHHVQGARKVFWERVPEVVEACLAEATTVEEVEGIQTHDLLTQVVLSVGPVALVTALDEMCIARTKALADGGS